MVLVIFHQDQIQSYFWGTRIEISVKGTLKAREDLGERTSRGSSHNAGNLKLSGKFSALRAYVSGESKRLEGWFARSDAEMFQTILEHQNRNKWGGSVAEIGPYHGRCFIAMCLALQNCEKAYCVDVFDAQDLTKDNFYEQSNRAAFEKNLTQFRLDRTRITVDAKSSQDVTPEDIMSAVGPVRLFSVDGGHWQEIVESDLKLAEACLCDWGIIALDDFYRPEWPDVSAGYFSWYAVRKKAIAPFAVGFNKLYLCHQNFVRQYQEALAENSFLEIYLSKSVEFQNTRLPVYQHYLLPEDDLKTRLKFYVKLFNPDIYVKASNFRRKLSRRARRTR